MFEEFYEMYEPEEREADVLIQKILGASLHGAYWDMMAVTLGMVFRDTGEVNIREGRLRWPVTEGERRSEKGWGRFRNGQICRVRVRKLRDEHTPKHMTPEKFNGWYVVKVLQPKVSCARLEAVWAEYIKPVVVEDEILGSLTLNRDFKQFEGSLAWGGSEVSLALDIDPENQSTWTRARSAAKKLLCDCETWDKAMRELAAKKLTGLANDWLSQDENNPRNPETDPITEEELARRISLTSLSVTSGGSFTAYFDCDGMFTDHAVVVYGSLKKGLKTAHIEG